MSILNFGPNLSLTPNDNNANIENQYYNTYNNEQYVQPRISNNYYTGNYYDPSSILNSPGYDIIQIPTSIEPSEIIIKDDSGKVLSNAESEEGSIKSYLPFIEELSKLNKDIDEVLIQLRDDIDKSRKVNSKNKYDNISKMYSSYNGILNTKLHIIKEGTNIVKISNDYDMKKVSNARIANAKDDDDSMIVELYDKLVTSDDLKSLKIDKRPNTDTDGSLPPELNEYFNEYIDRMSDLSSRTVLTYNKETGEKAFKTITNSGELIDGANLPSPTLLDNIMIDEANDIAIDKYLGDTYDLVIVNSNGIVHDALF